MTCDSDNNLIENTFTTFPHAADVERARLIPLKSKYIETRSGTCASTYHIQAVITIRTSSGHPHAATKRLHHHGQSTDRNDRGSPAPAAEPGAADDRSPAPRQSGAG